MRVAAGARPSGQAARGARCRRSAVYVRWSASITASLLTQLVPFTGGILGFYWPHRDEYDPLPVANAVMPGAGGNVALPVVVARRSRWNSANGIRRLR